MARVEGRKTKKFATWNIYPLKDETEAREHGRFRDAIEVTVGYEETHEKTIFVAVAPPGPGRPQIVLEHTDPTFLKTQMQLAVSGVVEIVWERFIQVTFKSRYYEGEDRNIGYFEARRLEIAKAQKEKAHFYHEKYTMLLDFHVFEEGYTSDGHRVRRKNFGNDYTLTRFKGSEEDRLELKDEREKLRGYWSSFKDEDEDKEAEAVVIPYSEENFQALIQMRERFQDLSKQMRTLFSRKNIEKTLSTIAAGNHLLLEGPGSDGAPKKGRGKS